MSFVTINFIHGRPACGKDTQVNLAMEFIPHSMKVSGIFRSAYTQTPPFAKYHELVAPYIKPLGQGIDIPGETVRLILEDIVNDGKLKGISTFFICGLLRTIDHKSTVCPWIELQNIRSQHIYLATPENKALKNTVKRSRVDAETDYPRIDDTPELMQARLDRFRLNTLPMLKELHQERRLSIIRADSDITSVHQEFMQVVGIGQIGIETHRTTMVEH